MKRTRKRTWPLAAISLACLACALFLVCSTWLQQQRVTDIDRFLTDRGERPFDASSDLVDGKSIDWEALRQVNPDVIGWLQIEGTHVNTPLVLAPQDDPDYYLTHNIYREQSMYGCPYLDAGCSSDFSSLHNVIYGHNMGWDDAVFADLANYADQKYAAQHRKAVIATPLKTITLRICAARVIEGSTALFRVKFESDEDFAAYCANVIAPQAYAIDGNFEQSAPQEAPRQLFTLCTCSYRFNPADERTLVFACNVDVP